MNLWIDFETKSECDLKKHGVYNYAQDATTDVLCMSYAFGDEEVQTWRPTQPFPDRVRNHAGLIYAHNSAFERLIFWYVLQIDFKLEQFYCTAAQARANCAPGSLEDVGRFSGSSMKKDHRGAQLIRIMCIPPFKMTDDLMAEMVKYCEQDVRTMRAISQSLRPLSPEELTDYHVNERINDRGVRVDVPLARAAIQYAAEETVEIQSLVVQLTGIDSARSPKMRQWVEDRIPDPSMLMVGDKKSLDKSVRAALLESDTVSDGVKELLQLIDDLQASSIAKFNRMADLADVEDERVRGAFVFNGGSATGRAASFGIQFQNMTRKCAKDPDVVRQAMIRGHKIVPTYGARVTDVLKGMLRPAIIPAAGKVFVVSDWSSIEARMNPWLSNCTSGMAKLDLFAKGEDVYKVNAAATFNVRIEDVTKDQRQIGKVQELACGFGGGIGAFAAMGRAYGIDLPEADARRMVDAWRRANPWAVRYWQDLEEAYSRAMRNKNCEFSAGRVTYMFDGLHLWYALPSGRILCYPHAKIDSEGITYAKSAWKPAADATEWPRARLWKGLACENITQAAANDVLRHSLRQLPDVILHCHDEIVVETDGKTDLEAVMCTPPAWCADLPLGVEVSTMTRYGK